MARPVTPLTDPKREAAKPREKEYKLFDCQGQYLHGPGPGMARGLCPQVVTRACRYGVA